MKKNLLYGILFVLLTSGTVHAALTTIGTATYNGQDYNLIWDDDNNGNSVVWLDYTNVAATYEDQATWAGKLGDNLTIKLDGYRFTSQGGWRLPRGIVGEEGFSTQSEMGHLFFIEFGFDLIEGNWWEYNGIWNSYNTEELNAQIFDNLIADKYWVFNDNMSMIEHKGDAWYFNMSTGFEMFCSDGAAINTIALFSAQVSEVPVPGAAWFLGSGLIGIAVVGRKALKPKYS